jgi:thiamine-phosphate pyrophosphorylase
MRRRQTMPRQWLIIADGTQDAIAAARRLPRGSGVLLLEPIPARAMLRLRTLARQSHLTIVAEQGRSAARVHNSRELRRALLARPRMILVSPVHPTGSHPEWKPLSRMRAAALARLAKRRAVALGGMDARRYAKIARLGFIGWAGISAFRT